MQWALSKNRQTSQKINFQREDSGLSTLCPIELLVVRGSFSVITAWMAHKSIFDKGQIGQSIILVFLKIVERKIYTILRLFYLGLWYSPAGQTEKRQTQVQYPIEIEQIGQKVFFFFAINFKLRHAFSEGWIIMSRFP